MEKNYGYGYKLVCVDDKFSKPFKSYLGEDAIYSFINSIIEESKFCTEIMKRHFNKTLVMTKEDNEDFENSNKCWIFDNVYVERDDKVGDCCYITGKYRGSAHRDCNINVKLNHKIPIVFHSLKNYNSYLIMEVLGKFNFKINVISNGLENHMSFNASNKLNFIDSFQFLRFSLDSFVKTWVKMVLGI